MDISTSIAGVALVFETRPSLFSPKRIDAGTLAMLSVVEFAPNDKVLDLGCGYGAVGVFTAKLIEPTNVFLLDNDPVAVECASANAHLNGVGGVNVVCSNGFMDFKETGFTKILCNPPYHADFALPKHFIHKGFNRLELGGTLWMVTKRDAWYRNKLQAIFGRVNVHPVDSYFVFEATKQSLNYASRG